MSKPSCNLKSPVPKAFSSEIRRSKICLPPELLGEEKLGSTQKLILSTLYGLSLKYDSGCTHSNQTLAAGLGIAEKSVCWNISQLVWKGLLLRLYRINSDGSSQRLLISPTMRAAYTFRALLETHGGNLCIDQGFNANIPNIRKGIAAFADYIEQVYQVNFDDLRAFAGLPEKHAFSQETHPQKLEPGVPEFGDNNSGDLKDPLTNKTPTPQAGADLLSLQTPEPGSLSVAQPAASPNPTETGILPPVELVWPAKPHPQFAKLRREYPGVLERVLAYCTGDEPTNFVEFHSDVARRLRRALRSKKVTLEMLGGYEIVLQLSTQEITVQYLLDNADDFTKCVLEQVGLDNRDCIVFEKAFTEPAEVKVDSKIVPLPDQCAFDHVVAQAAADPDAVRFESVPRFVLGDWTGFVLRAYRGDPDSEKRARFTRAYARFTAQWLCENPREGMRALASVKDSAEFKEVFGFEDFVLRAMLEYHRQANLRKWSEVKNRFGWLKAYAEKYFNEADENHFYIGALAAT